MLSKERRKMMETLLTIAISVIAAIIAADIRCRMQLKIIDKLVDDTMREMRNAFNEMLDKVEEQVRNIHKR